MLKGVVMVLHAINSADKRYLNGAMKKTIIKLLFISVLSAPLFADVQYYQDQFGANYDFLNIREVGSYGKYIGGSPSPGFKAMIPDSLALYPNGSNLNVNAYGVYGYGYGIPSSYATSQLSFSVKAKTGQDIQSVSLRLGGTYDLQYVENPVWGVLKENTASLSISCPISIQVIGINNEMISIPELLNNFAPSVEFNSSTKTWSVKWEIEDIRNLNPMVFSASSMQITELAFTVAPTLSAQTNQGSSSAYLNNLTFAVIPEPSSLSLLVLGGVVVALRRRKK
jgi:PEP-CTERM motif